MKSLVVYDSAYGNTAKIAEAINVVLTSLGESKISQISTINPKELTQLDLLVIGSPTQGGRPTKPTKDFIDELPDETLRTAKVAVFDTRIEADQQKKGLRLLMKIIGYAAPKMTSAIKGRGGKLVSAPQGFIVNDKEGPIKQGELQRASHWANQLAVN